MKTNFFFALLLIVTSTSCKKTSIKPDSENPDLPAYSQQGLNVGGMLINNKSWLTYKPLLFSTVYPLQLLSYPSGDSVVVLLNGTYKDSNFRYQQPNTIFVILKNIKIETDIDLIQLNTKSYILDGTTNYGGFSDNNGFDKVGNGIGKITFGKVSQISTITYGDGTPNNPVSHPYIISGQLEMNVITNSNYDLTKGRFDVNIRNGTNQFRIL